MGGVVPHERKELVQDRRVEQIMDVPVAQIRVEQIVEVVDVAVLLVLVTNKKL